MAGNKSSLKKAVPKNELPSISARIDRMVNYEGSNVRAIASVNIGGAFAIHGFKIYESKDKGLSVLCPATKNQKDGKYYEDAHPITGEARTVLNNAVLDAYEQRVHMEEDHAQDMDDAVGQGQTM